jgi:hypothetical protein
MRQKIVRLLFGPDAMTGHFVAMLEARAAAKAHHAEVKRLLAVSTAVAGLRSEAVARHKDAKAKLEREYDLVLD